MTRIRFSVSNKAIFPIGFIKFLATLEIQTEATRKSSFVLDWKAFSSLFATNSIEIAVNGFFELETNFFCFSKENETGMAFFLPA